jgi:hypothetical protein
MRACTKYLPIILLLILPVYISAIDLESLGYSIISEQQEDDRTVYNVSNAAGIRFSVQFSGELSAKSGSLIQRSLAEFYAWTGMDIAYLRISITDDGATVLIIPENYVHNGVDLTAFLPSGIQFYVDQVFEYDFRINVEKIFIRLRGQLNEENRFTERLASAIEDPAGFIERNDPEYVLRELRDIDDKLIELDIADEDLEILMNTLIEDLRDESLKIDDAIRADLAQTVSGLQRLQSDVSSIYDEATVAFNALRYDYIETKKYGAGVARDYFDTKRRFEFLKSRFESHRSEFSEALSRLHELQQAHNALEAEHLALKEQHEALVAKHEALDANHAALTDEFARFKTMYGSDLSGQEATDLSLQNQISWLRYAFIGIANKSFFGQLRHVEEDVAARIVQLKQQSPELTTKEIKSTLSAEEMKVSEKGVRYVLLTYLGIRDE